MVFRIASSPYTHNQRQTSRIMMLVCLAALHHIDDKVGFLGKLVSHTTLGSVLHVADVAQDAPIAAFLDSFVGRFNGTGHEGAYLEHGTFEQVEGVQIAAYEELAKLAWQAGYDWVYYENSRGTGPHVHASVRADGPRMPVLHQKGKAK